jgi:hypothetical protein
LRREFGQKVRRLVQRCRVAIGEGRGLHHRMIAEATAPVGTSRT